LALAAESPQLRDIRGSFLRRGGSSGFAIQVASAGKDCLADFLGDGFVIDQELLGVLAALAEPRGFDS
jgi:hypothetical protein